MHRAASSIFGRKNIESPTYEQQSSSSSSTSPLDNQSFIDIDQNNGGSGANPTNSALISHIEDSQFPNTVNSVSKIAMDHISTLSNSADQSIQYPPVFIPETYDYRWKREAFSDMNQ